MQIKETAAPYPAKEKIYTYEDYLNLPDDGKRYEIIEGELIMAASLKSIHQIVSGNLEYEIRSFVIRHKSGLVFDAPYDVKLSDANVVQPDIMFVSKENRGIITEDNIQGAPDLIIEILSPSTAYYDLIIKKGVYEKFKVKEYWIIDPQQQWIEIYVLKEQKFYLHQRSEKAGQIRSTVLEGFEMEIENIFEEKQ